jgi:hypothetical protein
MHDKAQPGFYLSDLVSLVFGLHRLITHEILVRQYICVKKKDLFCPQIKLL